MPVDVNLPALDNLMELGNPGTQIVQRVAGDAVLNQLRDYFKMLDVTHPNQLGGDRTHFWLGMAEDLVLETDDTAAEIAIPSPFGYLWLGGEIQATNKLLTVPARAEAYGHYASDFGDDLKFGIFRTTGTKFLADKKTGLVMYWLCEHVHGNPHPDYLPDEQAMVDCAINAVGDWWISKMERESGF